MFSIASTIIFFDAPIELNTRRLSPGVSRHTTSLLMNWYRPILKYIFRQTWCRRNAPQHISVVYTYIIESVIACNCRPRIRQKIAGTEVEKSMYWMVWPDTVWLVLTPVFLLAIFGTVDCMSTVRTLLGCGHLLVTEITLRHVCRFLSNEVVKWSWEKLFTLENKTILVNAVQQ